MLILQNRKKETFLLMYSMSNSHEQCLRYYSFNKTAPNHRSLTLSLRNAKMYVRVQRPVETFSDIGKHQDTQTLHNLAHLLYSNGNRSRFGHPSCDLSQESWLSGLRPWS